MDTQVIDFPNGMSVKVANFDGDFWIEIGSGASAVGKQPENLLRRRFKEFRQERYVSVSSYCQFLQEESAKADNFAARDLLGHVTSVGMKRQTKGGYLNLPTGEQVKAFEQDGRTYYDLDELCKALEIPKDEALEILQKIQDRGF